MSEQDNGQVTILKYPTTDKREDWKAYWEAQGQPWRTEPEINNERQKYLDERRNIRPDIEQGIYPFKDVRLSRADVEWLLATHENGRGPVDWNDENQQQRQGLDLCGADLHNEDLRALPLTGLHGGYVGSGTFGELKVPVYPEQFTVAAINLENSILIGAHLERAILTHARLVNGSLFNAHLEKADMRSAHLKNARLQGAYLAGANLLYAH